MTDPLRCGPALSPEAYARVRRRAILECCKWDPQVGDVSTLAEFPLLLEPDAWRGIAAAAEALAAETLAAEREILERPRLMRVLGLPSPVRRALADGGGWAPCPARLMRFDFHWTSEGWRISEANTDVPGGFVEAAGFTQLVCAAGGAGSTAGDPAAAFASAVSASLGRGTRVGFVHATAYTDDRQVMTFLEGAFRRAGVEGVLLSPADLVWAGGRAGARGGGFEGALDGLVRFYPAEWLPNLPRSSGWRHLFRGETPVFNPATAILTQSKRFPLVWDDLATPLPAWRSLLPVTRSPSDVDWDRDPAWMLKPALGRVGDGIGLRGVTSEKEWRAIRRAVRWSPRDWVAQRRFEAVPVDTPRGAAHPCLGVYTVGGRACGIYGRLARRPLVDHEAQDVAVLLLPGEPALVAGVA